MNLAGSTDHSVSNDLCRWYGAELGSLSSCCYITWRLIDKFNGNCSKSCFNLEINNHQVKATTGQWRQLWSIQLAEINRHGTIYAASQVWRANFSLVMMLNSVKNLQHTVSLHQPEWIPSLAPFASQPRSYYPSVSHVFLHFKGEESMQKRLFASCTCNYSPYCVKMCACRANKIWVMSSYEVGCVYT